MEKKILSDLTVRKLWKRVAEIYPKNQKSIKSDIEDQLERLKNSILQEYPSLEPRMKIDIIQDNPLKGLDREKAVLLVKDKDENYVVESDQNWLTESVIFEALSSRFLVGRLYVEGDTNTKEGKESYRKVIEKVSIVQ